MLVDNKQVHAIALYSEGTTRQGRAVPMAPIEPKHIEEVLKLWDEADGCNDDIEQMEIARNELELRFNLDVHDNILWTGTLAELDETANRYEADVRSEYTRRIGYALAEYVKHMKG